MGGSPGARLAASPDGKLRRDPLAGLPYDTNLVGDQWAAIWGRDIDVDPTDSPDAVMAKFEELDFAQMERVRARVDELVRRPITAEGSRPYTADSANAGHSTTIPADIQPTQRHPHRHRWQGLDRITETGIVFDGREYPVDCIVYATGFEFAVATTRSGDSKCIH